MSGSGAIMRVSLNLAALTRVHWYELVLRFVLGGLVTLATGVVAERAGAVIGGLFLAFPAILPASLTLIERHQTDRKRAGIAGRIRGRKAAALDAGGAALGGWGLAGFGLITWRLLPAHWTMLVLLLAALVWLALAAALWGVSRLHLLARIRAGARRS